MATHKKAKSGIPTCQINRRQKVTKQLTAKITKDPRKGRSVKYLREYFELDSPAKPPILRHLNPQRKILKRLLGKLRLNSFQAPFELCEISAAK